MRRTNLQWLLGAVFLLLPLLGWSQSLPDEKLKNINTTRVIDQMTALLKRYYLFEDTAVHMGQFMKERLNKGVYDAVMARQFARKVTNDLRAHYRDKHIGLTYAPKMAKMLNSGEENDGNLDREAIEELLAIEIYEGFRVPEVKRLNGNVGYLKIDQFLPPSYARGYRERMNAVFEMVSDTDAIIIDLRDNPGGYAEGTDLLLAHLFPPKTNLMTSISRIPDGGMKSEESFTPDELKGEALNQPLYILTSKRTASAAEAIAHIVKYSGRGTVVGQSTYGAGYLGNSFVVDEKFVATISYATGMHPNAEANWEGIGVMPDVEADYHEALNKAHTMAVMALLDKEKAKPKKEQYAYRLASLEWEANRLNDLAKAKTLNSSKQQEYVGMYEQRKISLKANNLYYTRPNRPKRRLIPIGNDEFLIEGLDSYRMKFARDKKTKKVVRFKLVSTDRLFVYTRGAD